MDIYDDAINYLEELPEMIEQCWDEATHIDEEDELVGKHLFKMAADKKHEKACGCLTQIRNLTARAQTEELTAAIRADERIPRFVSDIRVKDLPVFAEWQRKLDIILERT